jgi:uncharacterized protein YxjI
MSEGGSTQGDDTMRHMIREKFFHLGEDSIIMNDAGQPIMQVDGRF